MTVHKIDAETAAEEYLDQHDALREMSVLFSFASNVLIESYAITKNDKSFCLIMLIAVDATVYVDDFNDTSHERRYIDAYTCDTSAEYRATLADLLVVYDSHDNVIA